MSRIVSRFFGVALGVSLVMAPAGVPALAQTVVLVRHAEKDAGNDPSLLPKGQLRAQALAESLKYSSVDLILVSSAKRTQETARPLAQEVSLKPETIGNPEAIIRRIRSMSADATIVVVGHSDTVPTVIGLLLGTEDRAVTKEIPQHEYDRLSIVVLDGKTTSAVIGRYGASSAREGVAAAAKK